jgi:hypothetical protein
LVYNQIREVLAWNLEHHHQINIWEDPTWNLGSSHLALYYPIGIHWDVFRHLKLSKMVSGYPKPPDSESNSVVILHVHQLAKDAKFF